MKIILSIFLIFVIASLYAVADEITKPSESSVTTTEQIIPEILRNGLYADECIAEIEVPEEDVKKVKAKDIANASTKIQCYINCVMEKDNLILNGILNDNVIYEKLQNETTLDEEELTKIYNICKIIEGDDKCDIAYRLAKCFIEHKAHPIVWKIATVIY